MTFSFLQCKIKIICSYLIFKNLYNGEPYSYSLEIRLNFWDFLCELTGFGLLDFLKSSVVNLQC